MLVTPLTDFSTLDNATMALKHKPRSQAFPRTRTFLKDSRSKAVCDEEWVTIVLAQVLFLHILDLLAWYIMNGLKLQTGRPPSCDIWKSLFKNSLCVIHCIVPTLPPLYSRRQISVNLLVLYRPSVGPVRSFTLIIIIEMYRF